MPKSQGFPAPALLLPPDPSFNCSGFRPAQHLPVASALRAGTGHPQFHLLSRISCRSETSHSAACRPRGRCLLCSDWEVLRLTEELLCSWGRTATRHDGHACAYCSFHSLRGFLLLPALPVPAPDKLLLLDRELETSLGMGLTFNEKHFFLLLPEMSLLLLSSAGPNDFVRLWEIGILEGDFSS